MTYIKQTWHDEALADDARYDIIADDETPIETDVEIKLSTDVITAGTPLTAERMNHIENGIETIDGALASGNAANIHALTAKATPVNNDELPILDSEDSNTAKKVILTDLWDNYLKNRLGESITEGTWMPSTTGVDNVSASSGILSYYNRVGSQVFCWGAISVTPTSLSTRTTVRISIPVASNFSVARMCVGTCARQNQTDNNGYIYADTSNYTALAVFTSASTNPIVLTFAFSYLVVV